MDKGAKIVAYDPMALPSAKKILGEKIDYADTPQSAIKGSDCTVIMTEWDQFRKLRPKDFRANMKLPNILDARRIYDPEEFRELNYSAIGLGKNSSPG
jgi:UDPglucose 6-dehydrogenase